MAVSCHAALTAAAARRNATVQENGICEQPKQHCHQVTGHSNGHACGSVCDVESTSKEVKVCTAAIGDSSSSDVATAADLLSALDGNLCRCTGWRPIADMAKVSGWAEWLGGGLSWQQACKAQRHLSSQGHHCVGSNPIYLEACCSCH